MSVKIRIKDYIKAKGITNSFFEKEINVSNGYINSISKSIGADVLLTIIDKFPDLNPKWLILEEGKMIRDNSINFTQDKDPPDCSEYKLITGKDPMFSPVIPVMKSDSGIPLVSIRAIGGFGNDHFALSHQDVKDYYVIPKFKHKEIDFMIEVEGSSMYPKYSSGDIVACKIIKERNFIQWNKTHVVATRNQGIIIKRIKQGKKKTHLCMISDNASYDPFEVPEEEITGIAIVVGVIRFE